MWIWGDTNNEDKSYRITKLHRGMLGKLSFYVTECKGLLWRTLNAFSIDIYEGDIDDDD